jgi:voltage-gated potassium channel
MRPSISPLAVRTWQVLEGKDPGDRLNRVLDGALLSLILLNVLASIVGTVPETEACCSRGMEAFERFSMLVFSAEYLARVWAAPVDSRYRGAFGRLRYVSTPMAVIDLLAVLPFYLAGLGGDLRFVRALRLFRFFRVVKLARYVTALGLLASVVRSKREELLLTALALAILLVTASSLMFYAEHTTQPDKFSSIPATMWWAVSTITTVGYGDVYPMTPMGRVLGAGVSVLGVAFFAFPTAILGSGFVDAVNRRRAAECCPHCGRALNEPPSSAPATPGRRVGRPRRAPRQSAR